MKVYKTPNDALVVVEPGLEPDRNHGRHAQREKGSRLTFSVTPSTW